jgi:TetR/AcrR family transcriptional regulator, regulator of cefoperazone and chloramphenicol sensitivity
MHVGRDITDELAPSLNAGERAVESWVDRLTLFGLAMVQAEAARRAS